MLGIRIGPRQVLPILTVIALTLATPFKAQAGPREEISYQFNLFVTSSAQAARTYSTTNAPPGIKTTKAAGSFVFTMAMGELLRTTAWLITGK